MKRTFSFLSLFITLALSAQHTISGSFSPAEEFKWLIVYELTPGSQKYIADAKVKNGETSISLPADATPGVYRLVYAVPQEEFYIDVLYNGTEDIAFSFSTATDVTFTSSVENKTYRAYKAEILALEQQLADFYTNKNTDTRAYMAIVKELSETQTKYEDRAKIPLTRQFVTANEPYLPYVYEPLHLYLTNRKKSFFSTIDFNSSLLQSSEVLTQKVQAYVFSALPDSVSTPDMMQDAILEAVQVVAPKLDNTPERYQITVWKTLWETAHNAKFYTVSDYIFKTFLEDLAVKNADEQLLDLLNYKTRVRLGSIAPDVVWQEGEETKTLLGMEGDIATKYLMVFWSSTCSHCLKEVPELQKQLKSYKDIVVLAVALEDDTKNWEKEILNFPDFKHAIALGKWQSEYAQLYGIRQTPTYFMLDAEKRFTHFPENLEGVLEQLKE